MEEKTNGKEKDRLFCFIFGREENKKWSLSLYNAVNGTNHSNLDDIEITTMGDVIYMGMKNDVSFIVGSEISLYEHQSTYNPNMPEDFEIKKFIMEHLSEVRNMCLTEYDEAKTMQLFKEEGREEERANTERERKRAEKAEAEVAILRKEIERLRSTASL